MILFVSCFPEFGFGVQNESRFFTQMGSTSLTSPFTGHVPTGQSKQNLFLGLFAIKEFLEAAEINPSVQFEIKRRLRAIELEYIDGLKSSVEDSGRVFTDSVTDFDEWAKQSLTQKQRDAFEVQHLYHCYRLSTLEPTDYREFLPWLQREEFWDTVESPSRELRRRAIIESLDCLTESQHAKLKRLLTEEGLNGSHLRNDVLFHHLQFEKWGAAAKMEADDSDFRDLRWAGGVFLNPVCEVDSQFNSKARVPMTIKLRLFSDPNFQDRLDFSDSQRAEFNRLYQQVEDLNRQLMEEIEQEDMASWSSEELVRRSRIENHPGFTSLQAEIEEQLKSSLLKHQRDHIRTELAIQLYPIRGIVWLLTESSVGELLEVSAEQKAKIFVAAKKSAMYLQRESELLEQKSFILIQKTYSNDEKDQNQLSLIRQRHLFPNSCCYPECLIPASIISQAIGRDLPKSPFALKRLMFPDDKARVEK
jgi:hypothetical protein